MNKNKNKIKNKNRIRNKKKKKKAFYHIENNPFGSGYYYLVIIICTIISAHCLMKYNFVLGNTSVTIYK